MLLNRWNWWFVVIGAILIGVTESLAQFEPKPLPELDRLQNWYPVYKPASSGLPTDLSLQPYAYENFDQLLQKIKEGSKVEALTINGQVWKPRDLGKLAQLQTVRVLHLNGLAMQQIDSLFQIIQHWSTLERLTLYADQLTTNRTDITHLATLPASIQQLQQVHDVRLNGNGLQWQESIKIVAGLKNLRRLELDNWNPSKPQSIDLSQLPQLTIVRISGQSWLIKPESFQGLGQLKELTLANVKADSTTFQTVLNGLPDLETLTLQNIRSLRQLTLGQLTNLRSVQLMGNTDLVLDAATFAGLSKLEELTIQRPQRLDMSGLCSLTHLRTLSISGIGKPAQLPDCIGQLSQLTELRLENIALDRLPTSISSLRQLKKLNLSFCRIDSLPATISQLPALEELYLEGNKLRNLTVIGPIRTLRQLIITNNQLTELPATIGQLTQLTALNASGNKLTQLPSSLNRLVSLRTLALQGNQLESLPDEVGKLRKLTFLSLNNNQLTELPGSIGQLDSLQKLFIGNNRLKSLPNTLSRLKSLKELYIGTNQLTELPPEIGGLKQLTNLTIELNPITELPASICELRNLESLTIMGTQLRLLPDHIGALTKLKQVTLTNNELIALPGSIGQWKDLTSLILEQNKLEGLPNSIGRLAKLMNLRISGKDKVVEGATGGLQQLPDSIIYCTRLWDLLIERQPQLDANDVFTKAARLKSLTHLKIASCNLSHLPEISWKDVNWNMLVMNQNLLTELPVGVLEAPRLFIIAVSENRLPDVLNRDFHDKEALRVAFVEAGMLPLESLSKPNRRISSAYQQLAMQKARERDWTGAMSDLEKAIDYAPDTILAFPYAQRASMHFFRKEYPEALADYDKAIQYAPQFRKDKSLDTLTSNRMLATYWQQKAAILGITGKQDEAYLAITQAERVLPATDNTPLSGLIYTESGRYLSLKDKLVEADSSYRKAIRAYEKLTYPEPGIRLTIIELSVLTGQYDRAQRAINNLPAEQIREGYDILKEYLATCLAVLKGEQTGTQATEQLSTYFTKHPAKVYGWSFDLFDNWLTKSKLPPEKVTALRQLTDATKERLVKPPSTR